MIHEEVLTKEEKIKILRSRVSQLIIEEYQNFVGLKVANKLNDQERINQIQEILDIIKVSLDVHIEELDSLLSSESE